MIITRTPLRIPLGGGGTDLPGFYQKHGGYIFSATIDKYLYVTLHKPVLDEQVRVQFAENETVPHINELQHEYARAVLSRFGIEKAIGLSSVSDIPAGTGLGSSGAFLVGLIKAIQAFKRQDISIQELAELACDIEMNELSKPVGKHDQYLASFGGFVEMYIEHSGKVSVIKTKISMEAIDELENKCFIFFTHQFHKTSDILAEQNSQAAVAESQVEKSLLKIKEIGQQLKSEFEQGNIRNFGRLMDDHWQVKKLMTNKISNPVLDQVYEAGKAAGAEGGKLMGSGGGGLFLFYCPGDPTSLRKVMKELGLTELFFRFSFGGSQVLQNTFDYRRVYA